MKYTRKDFIATARLIKALPKKKRRAAFEEWSDKFVDDNDNFDEEKFATACGFNWDQYQSEYRHVRVYTPPPAEVIPVIPEGLNHITTVAESKRHGNDHWDVFLNDEKIGYIYKCFYTTDNAQFNADQESRWYPLVRHVYNGNYNGIYRLCNIFNAFTLNSNRTISIDCTGKNIGWCVVRKNGLMCGEGNFIEVFNNGKLIKKYQPKFGELIPDNEGIFIKEQLGKFYNQIAYTHATVWFDKKDAIKIARKIKGTIVVSHSDVCKNHTEWERRSLEQQLVDRQKEFDIAHKNLRK